MKKLLLTLMACLTLALALPRQAHALTAADLDGLYYGAYMVGMGDAKKSFATDQFCGKFELRGSKLYMTNFWDGFDIPVTVSGNSIYIPTNYVSDNGTNSEFLGTRFRIEQSTIVTRNRSYYPLDQWGYDWGTVSWRHYGYKRVELDNVGNAPQIVLNLTPSLGTSQADKQTDDSPITSDSYNYRFASNQPYCITNEKQDGEYVSNGDGIRVYVFETNSIATETYEDGSIRTYGVGIDMSEYEPEKVVLRNVLNKGVNFSNQYNNGNWKTIICWMEGLLDYENMTISMSDQSGGGSVDYPEDLYLGTTWLYTTTWADGEVFADWYSGASEPPVLKNWYVNNPMDKELIGRIILKDIAHNTESDNHWSTLHDGQLKTLHKMDFEFDDLSMWQINQMTLETERLKTVPKTVYETPYFYEYTHEASLKLDWFAQDVNQIGFGGKIISRVNSRYIDSYDLYIIPGSHKSINDEDITTHHDKGIEGAELLVSGLKPVATTRSADGEDPAVTIEDRIIPRPIPYNSNRDYTLFLKANYNNGLHPTYHAMTEAAGLPTGVGTIMDDGSMVTVRPVAGGVEVEGYDGMVEVYSVAGTCVFSGVADGLIELSQGTYIVRAAQRSWKVNVN